MQNIIIGIPAYNEETNIKKLIRSVLDQKTYGFTIVKVIVSSDGSTDNTSQNVEAIKDNRVILINNKTRCGIARGLNQIIAKCDSEILVTLDADIKIVNKNFLSRLVKPIMENRADLTSSSIREILPESKMARVLNTSMRLKEILFKVFKNGNNIYSCHGLARAYSKNFYTKLHFPVSIGNDMYSYLKCVSGGYRFEYTPNAIVYYHLPDNFQDHQKQSERFFISEFEMEKIFGKALVKEKLHIPYFVYLMAFLKAIPIIFKNPIDSLSYLLIQLYLKYKPKRESAKLQKWNIAVSSKNPN